MRWSECESYLAQIILEHVEDQESPWDEQDRGAVGWMIASETTGFIGAHFSFEMGLWQDYERQIKKIVEGEIDDLDPSSGESKWLFVGHVADLIASFIYEHFGLEGDKPNG